MKILATKKVMDSKPLVSVIMPFYNTSPRFMREAVESVLVQSYDQWELLLVDDGSTIESSDVARAYAQQHPGKVRYLEHERHENRGACASRNLGIRQAKGEYIALLDSDDVWLSRKLEQQVAILGSQPEAAMVYGASQYWYSWTGKPEDGQLDYVQKPGVHPNILYNPPILLTLSYPLGKGSAPCPSNLLLRREIVEQIGGFEEEFRGIYQLYEDQAFLTKVYLAAPVFVASECWDRHRLHPDSCVSVVIKEGHYHSVRLFFLNWLEEYLSKQGVEDTAIWQTLRTELWFYRHPTWLRLRARARYLAKGMRYVRLRLAELPLPAFVRR